MNEELLCNVYVAGAGSNICGQVFQVMAPDLNHHLSDTHFYDLVHAHFSFSDFQARNALCWCQCGSCQQAQVDPDFMSGTITSVKCCVLCYDTTSSLGSGEPAISKTEKACQARSSTKSMLVFFFNFFLIFVGLCTMNQFSTVKPLCPVYLCCFVVSNKEYLVTCELWCSENQALQHYRFCFCREAFDSSFRSMVKS